MKGLCVQRCAWTVLAALAFISSALPAYAVPIEVGPDGILIKDGRPYRAVGVNYVDAFWRHYNTPTNTSYVQGFNALVSHNIPFARVAISPMWPNELRMYVNYKETYLSRLDDVVNAAENAGLGLILTFFWKTWTVPDIVGEHVNQWANPDSATIAFMREYVTTIVTRYVDSPAVWAWEFGNEWSLDADIIVYSDGCTRWKPPIDVSRGTPATRTCDDYLYSEEEVAAINEFTATVRAVDPDRPISSGHSLPRSGAEMWRVEDTYSGALDTEEEFETNFNFINPSGINLPSVHLYPSDFTEDYRNWGGEVHTPTALELMTLTEQVATRAGKALFLGEFGAPGTTAAAIQTNLDIINIAIARRIDLASVWNFDWGTTDWNITFTNTRKAILTAIEQANVFLAAQLEQEWYVDNDHDGLPDVIEDANQNGITDPDETDPNDPDTDGDGVSDGLEAAFDYDPLDPNDTPALPAASWPGLAVLSLGMLSIGMLLILLMAGSRFRAHTPGRV